MLGSPQNVKADRGQKKNPLICPAGAANAAGTGWMRRLALTPRAQAPSVVLLSRVSWKPTLETDEEPQPTISAPTGDTGGHFRDEQVHPLQGHSVVLQLMDHTVWQYGEDRKRQEGRE